MSGTKREQYVRRQASLLAIGDDRIQPGSLIASISCLHTKSIYIIGVYHSPNEQLSFDFQDPNFRDVFIEIPDIRGVSLENTIALLTRDRNTPHHAFMTGKNYIVNEDDCDLRRYAGLIELSSNIPDGSRIPVKLDQLDAVKEYLRCL